MAFMSGHGSLCAFTVLFVLLLLEYFIVQLVIKQQTAAVQQLLPTLESVIGEGKGLGS